MSRACDLLSSMRVLASSVRLTAAIASILAGCMAHAEGGDDLKFRATLGFLHDDNLFRLPSSANTAALVGRASGAETVRLESVGLDYDKAYSLQRVRLNVDLARFNYQNFSYLSYTARNYQASWLWSYTPHLHGTVSTSRNETLNSFTDFRGFNVRNTQTNLSTRADATYELDARWRIFAGAVQTSRRNEEVVVQDSDSRGLGVDAGVRYVLPTGSSLSYSLRQTTGKYLHRQLSAAALLDTDFEQTDSGIQATWVISPDTSADVQFGLRSRRHPNFPQRDFSGVTGAANLRWNASAQTAWTFGWSRDIGSYQTQADNAAITQRISFGPEWQIGPKTSLRARVTHAVRDYAGTTGLAPPSQRRDTSNDASVALDWRPFSYVAFSASLQNSRRSSNLPGLGFNAHILNLTAQLIF